MCEQSNNRDDNRDESPGNGNNGINSNTFIRSQPGVVEESAILRVSQRQRQNQTQTQTQTQSPSGGSGSSSEGGTNSALVQELALVAEAKRLSEQEASGTTTNCRGLSRISVCSLCVLYD